MSPPQTNANANATPKRTSLSLAMDATPERVRISPRFSVLAHDVIRAPCATPHQRFRMVEGDVRLDCPGQPLEPTLGQMQVLLVPARLAPAGFLLDRRICCWLR